VVATAAGRVTIAGRLSDGAVIVEIEHAPGAVSRYGHLATDLRVQVGGWVGAGDLLGFIGLTGNTTGPHLHLEIYVSGQPVDPLSVLPPQP
jgi:murein DD-endopeptidase MepM/ murein hydrolase activator NlpD